MKYTHALQLFFVTLLIFSFVSKANADFCDRKTHVFFGNGMFNDYEQATNSKYSLENSMRPSGNLSEDQWAFDISYNHDEKLFSLFEVFRQREGERASTFWRWISGLSFAPDWFRDKALELASHQPLAEAVIDADLRRHIDSYRSLLMEGNRVLVVAHSQGNLYANAAYANLARDDNHLQMNAFGIVAVATPSSQVAGGGSYYTLTNDLVIDTVRLFYWDTLPGNVTNSVPDSDWKHHSFVDAYLKGDQSGPMIVGGALSRANSLVWPVPTVGNGPISITLTWGAQPDVDLHVYEPDGTHVYYASPLGTTGYLDYDDVSSRGPEHYYVTSCDTLAVGTYTVGLNYFYGSAPETARVHIKAGDIVRDYSALLVQPEGSRGDSNPETVANIEVTGNLEEGYSFTIFGR